MNTNRIACTLAAAALAATCAVAAPASQTKPDGKPNLVFGVLSDTHIRDEKDGEALRKAFDCFRRQHVDGVVIAGDITLASTTTAKICCLKESLSQSSRTMSSLLSFPRLPSQFQGS